MAAALAPPHTPRALHEAWLGTGSSSSPPSPVTIPLFRPSLAREVAHPESCNPLDADTGPWHPSLDG